MKATGNGNPFVWNVGGQVFFSAKKESEGYAGVGLEYFATSKGAIGAYYVRDNVINEVKIRLKEIIITFPIAYQANNKILLLLEPGFIYMGFVRGTITAYGNTYNEKNLFDFGWNVNAGINWKIKNYFGLSARAGYRHLTAQEVHKDSRSGYELTYSFFANGVDGNNTIVKWSGLYVTTGIYFSFDSKASGKQTLTK